MLGNSQCFIKIKRGLLHLLSPSSVGVRTKKPPHFPYHSQRQVINLTNQQATVDFMFSLCMDQLCTFCWLLRFILKLYMAQLRIVWLVTSCYAESVNELADKYSILNYSQICQVQTNEANIIDWFCLNRLIYKKTSEKINKRNYKIPTFKIVSHLTSKSI